MFKIRYSAIKQFILIYLLIILNQSQVYRIFINTNSLLEVVVIGLLFLFLISNYFYSSRRVIYFCLYLLLSVIFVRIIQGGIGITIWYEMTLKLLVIYAAILADKEMFLTRFVKVVVFFAAISIVGWSQQIIGLDLFTKFAPAYKDYRDIVSWGINGRNVTEMYVHGLLLYTTSDFEFSRNIGIFTEPGIYQMVLNSAIFILLFFSSKVFVSAKRQGRYLIICIIALILTQSTSGYLGLFVLILGMLFVHKNEIKMTQYIALFILCVGIIVLIVDLSIRGNLSFFYKAVLSKVFSSSGSFDINASTGRYRVASTMMAIQAMFTHPLGLGVDKWMAYSSVNELAGAGGWPFKLGAILGIVPFAVTMHWIFSPLKYIKEYKFEICIIVFLYFNSCLAQSSAFYPVLLVVPVYLSITEKIYRKQKNNEV